MHFIIVLDLKLSIACPQEKSNHKKNNACLNDSQYCICHKVDIYRLAKRLVSFC